MSNARVEHLASQIQAGSVRALGRGLTWIEAGRGDAEALIEQLYPFSGRAHVVGITGAPGSGKSTLTTALTHAIRARGLTVGIIAIDPSSPFSGGSILGDRIRMTDIGNDRGVFIRSMATRGLMGGLCGAARDGVDLMDVAGKAIVIVETVGVGQDEVDIMRLAHTTLVLSVPGLGDDIQAMKAGIIEIADVHVVNKADKDGAERTVAELHAMLTLSSHGRSWETPIVSCIATTGVGVEQLLAHVMAHGTHLKTTGDWGIRERQIAETRVLKLAQQLVADALERPIDTGRKYFSEAIARVAERELSPIQCARSLLMQVSEREKTTHV